MAIVNDDMNEDNVHLSLLDSLTSNFGEDISRNDIAWADSCLNDDLVGPSNTDWSSIKDALLEILSSQAGSADSVAAQNNTQFSIDEDLSVHNYVAGLSLGRETDNDEDLVDYVIGDVEDIENSDDDEGNLITANKRDLMRTRRRTENVFRPAYSEDMVKVDNNDTGMDLNLPTHELLDSLSEDIFKVWDLGISEEQDDFTKQLDKVFSDFPLPTQPNPVDSTVWENGTRVSVNDLVSGMGDLSLNQNTN